MYNIDDIVIYGTHGVCRITEITEKEFASETQLYYTIKPVFNTKSTFFLPVNHQNTAKKLFYPLPKGEIKALIASFPKLTPVTVTDEKQRRDIYKQVIESGDRKQIAGLLKTLYQRKKEQLNQGKKQHLIDERFMKDAETVLYEEFAYVLQKDRGEILTMVTKQFEKENK